MNDDDRAGLKSDALQLMLIREGVSLLAGLAVFWLLTSPKASMWIEHQAWRLRQYQQRDRAREARLIAELHRDISAYEHGQAGI